MRTSLVLGCGLVALLAGCGDGTTLDIPVVTKLTLDEDVLVESGSLTEVEVASAHTFHFVVTPVGTDLAAGTVLEVEVPATFDQPQTSDPTVPGYTVAGRFDAATWNAVTEEDSSALDSGGAQEGEDLEVTVYLADEDPEDGDDGELTGTEPWVARVELASALGADETLEVVYGDTSGGALGARSSPLAREGFTFDVRLDLDGDGEFVSASSYAISALAGEAKALRVYPASQASSGGTVPVRASVFDGYGNAATGVDEPITCTWQQGDTAGASMEIDLGGSDASSAEEAVTGPDGSGPWRLACSHPTLPVYVEGATIVEEAASSEEGAPPPGPGAAGSYLLWGDLHIHSTVSGDAAAYSLSPTALYSYARTTSGLDIASVSDHDRTGILTQTNFESQEIAPANAAYAPGSFVTLLSWEWTDSFPTATQTEGGHKIVYYLQGDGSHYCVAGDTDSRCTGANAPQMYANTSTASDSACELWTLLTTQSASSTIQAITFPHHVASLQGPARTAWQTVPADCGGGVQQRIQPISEIFSEHGNNEGWNGAAAGTIEDPIMCSGDLGRMVQEAQEYRWGGSGDKPHYLGVIGASDNHTGRPGQDQLPRTDTTQQGSLGLGVKCSGTNNYRWRETGLSGVWVSASDFASAHDRTKVYDALRSRRVYGTTGSRITLNYYLDDLVAGVHSYVDQGGYPLQGTANLDNPEYAIASAAGHDTSLVVENICPGSGDAPLESVSILRGTGTPGSGGSWSWSTVASFTSFDQATGCLLSGSVPLITGGVIDGSTASVGKSLYYAKVKEVNQMPVRVDATHNSLRIGKGAPSVINCTLTQGTWLPSSYAAQLQADLNASSCGGALQRTFTVTYDNVADGNFASDFRFKITANLNFYMDNNTGGVYPVAEKTAAMLGFAAADKSGRATYTGDDQVQNYENAEYAWSSPIWVDLQAP